MKLYGAIDLHSTNSVTVLIDEQDEVVYQKRLPNDLALIVQQLAPYASSIEGIVVESTYNWYWLVDGLMEKGHRVHLANTAAIQQPRASGVRPFNLNNPGEATPSASWADSAARSVIHATRFRRRFSARALRKKTCS